MAEQGEQGRAEERRLAYLRRIAESGEDLAGMTGELIEVVRTQAKSTATGVADEVASLVATRIVAEEGDRLDEEGRRTRFETSQRRRGSLLAMLIGLFFAVTFLEYHNHIGHVQPMEHRLMEIEELIAEVDATISNGRLPDLDHGVQFETGSNLPMFPAPEQQAPPMGLIFYTLIIVLTLVLWAYDRRLKVEEHERRTAWEENRSARLAAARKRVEREVRMAADELAELRSQYDPNARSEDET